MFSKYAESKQKIQFAFSHKFVNFETILKHLEVIHLNRHSCEHLDGKNWKDLPLCSISLHETFKHLCLKCKFFGNKKAI